MDNTKKLPWKQTQVNLCSIFGSQHYDSRHFEYFKVSAINIKCNENLNYNV